MDSNNTFQNGMNSDISKLYQANNQYVKALNFRPVTELGSSNASLVNIKGNECAVSFPMLRSVFKLVLRKQYNEDGIFLPGIIVIKINNESTANISIAENTTIEDVAGAISILPNCYGSLTGVPSFAMAYNPDYIIIYQQPEYSDCSNDTSAEPEITITQITGTSGMDFMDADGNTSSSATAFIPNLNLADPLVVIGSTFINEASYLFTCSENNAAKTGQIWKLTFDELTQTTTLFLKYYSYLNFTIDHPIPTSAAIGRYELNNLQRIYWTDFYNPVRTINIEGENLMALNPDLVNLRPLINMSVPVLMQIIDGGAVNNISNHATYQCAYRLTKNNGAVTNYSSLSNIVAPIPQDTGNYVKTLNNFSSMSATGVASDVNKALKFEVQGVDTDYDNIEFFIITRDVSNIDLFYVYKFDTQVINGNSTMTTTWVNDPNTNEEITISEFLIENVLFSHCKTLEQKDNRLFFGNVKSDIDTILDTFDTRTYRFIESSNVFDVMKFEGDVAPQPYIINTNNDYATIPDNADLIPLINLGMSTADDPFFDFEMKYKRLSSTVGGSGPNISYSFGNLLLRADAFPLEPNVSGSTNEGSSRDNPGSGQQFPYGYRKAAGLSNGYLYGSLLDPTFYNGAPNQRYRQNNSLNTMGLEYLSGAFRSYQHNEIYSFGIVFKSRTGESSFVKWIGDIKFPDYQDEADINLRDKTEQGASCPDFRSMFYDTTNPSDPSAYLVVPYINFEVNIPKEIANIISGYEIVRCLRTQADRTIKSQGLITQVATGVADSNFYMPYSHYTTPAALNLDACDPIVYPVSSGYASKDLVCYHSMESLVDNSDDNFEDGDKLILTEVYSKVWDAAVNPGNFAIANPAEKYYIKKYYNQAYFLYRNTYFGATDIHDVKEGYYVAQGADSPTISVVGTVYKNRDQDPAGGSGWYSYGSPTVVVGIKNSTFDWNPFIFAGVCSTAAVQGNAKMLGIHFKGRVLKTQYGGRTNTKRATREYIPTGAYYPVTETGTYTIKVFGGDVFHGILDAQKCIKNWTGTQVSTPEKHSQTWFFPHQSYKNVDLRDGAHVNADLDNDAGSAASAIDDYIYVSSFSFENTLKKYYPRPIFFNLTNEWNNRVYFSEVKINGETSDNWTNVFVNSYYDVEGSYGPINALQILKNNMYFVQDRAIGLLIINPYETVTTQNLQSIGIGTGDTIQKHVYYSIDSGSKHQWSVNRSNTHITFVDSRHKKIFLFDGQSVSPISDTKGNRGFVNKVLHDNILVNDNPIIGKGILTTYDYINNEFLYTFLNTYITDEPPNYSEKYTLVYSDLIDAFSSFYSFTPYIYINNHNKLFSLNSYDTRIRSKIYIHNIGNYCNFYDNIYPSTLKVNINENPIHTKVFDNLSWISESIKDNLLFKDPINNYLGDSDDIPYLNDTITKVRAYNEYQNTDWITLSTTFPNPTLRKSEQGYNMQVPRNKVNYNTTNINTKSIFDPTILTKTLFGDRMRDKYLVVDLEYNNILNNRFILHNLKSTYRISDR